MKGLACLLLALAMMGGTAWVLRSRVPQATPLSAPLSAFPETLDGWRMTADTAFTPSELAVLRPTDYLARRYAGAEGQIVELYIGYHDGGQNAGGLHSPRNCLPGGGWLREKASREVLPLGGHEARLAMALFAKENRRELFAYTFLSGGETHDNEYRFALHRMLRTVWHGRQDTALVRVNVPMTGTPEEARTIAFSFLKTALPAILRALPGES